MNKEEIIKMFRRIELDKTNDSCGFEFADGFGCTFDNIAICYDDRLKLYELTKQLEKENQELKKQYCERTDCSGRVGNSKKVEQLEKENQRLKEIEKEHQKINGDLRVEIKELKEKYMKLEDKYIHNVSCCNEEDCDLFCEHQKLKENLKATNKVLKKIILKRKKWKHRYQLAKHEIKELKKQLEEYKHKGLYNTCLPYSTGYKKAIKEMENQQKEFIELLEKMWKETQDIWYIKILQKYKEIIGDKQ